MNNRTIIAVGSGLAVAIAAVLYFGVGYPPAQDEVSGTIAPAQRYRAPTIDESGVKGFSSSTFFSLMAPPRTPAEIRAKLNKAIVAAMQTPEAQAKLKTIFVEASKLDTKEMGEFVKAEAKLWGDVIRAANITVEQ